MEEIEICRQQPGDDFWGDGDGEIVYDALVLGGLDGAVEQLTEMGVDDPIAQVVSYMFFDDMPADQEQQVRAVLAPPYRFDPVAAWGCRGYTAVAIPPVRRRALCGGRRRPAARRRTTRSRAGPSSDPDLPEPPGGAPGDVGHHVANGAVAR
jgi:hypothetical protein